MSSIEDHNEHQIHEHDHAHSHLPSDPELRELKELVNIIKSGKIKLIPVKKQDLETANQAMLDLRSGKVNGRIVLIPK